MIEIRLEDDAVRAALARRAARLTDMTPVMQAIGDVLMASTRDRRLAGRIPDGSPFAPRAQTTLARYAAMRPPARPFLGLSETDRRDILAIVAEVLEEAAG
jgi:phage gpG-like protein